MQWDWETCGGFLILPSKTGEVRLYVCVCVLNNKIKISVKAGISPIHSFILLGL